MAEILIKGMEMPKTCRRCLEMEIPVRCRVKEQEPVTAVMSGYDRPNDCPLVELPPHGRLVDIDKMKLDFKATVVNCIKKDPNRSYQYKEAERLVLGILKRTHNVIPASEGTD